MVELLRTWWPVLLLVYVPSLVRSVFHILVMRAFRKLDESHPDDMPHTAGEWLNLEIVRLGYQGRVKVITTDDDAKASIDAYHPQEAVIQLQAETYFKRDPMHWAIAAHEFGHARFRLDWPKLGHLLIASRILNSFVIAFALAFTLGNVVFAQPGFTDIGFKLFVLACVLHLGVLLDEAVASTLALRQLYASNTFDFAHQRSARRVLLLAYATYAVSFLVHAGLLSQWWLVEKLSAIPNVPPTASLTTLGKIGALVATLGIVMYSFGRFMAVLAPKKLRENVLLRLAYQFGLLAIILLVWNHRADREWALLVIFALVNGSGWFIALLSLPMIVIDVVLLNRWKSKYRVKPTHETTELQRDKSAGRALRRSGNAALNELVERSHDVAPTWALRLVNLSRLVHMPLLLAYWFG